MRMEERCGRKEKEMREKKKGCGRKDRGKDDDK